MRRNGRLVATETDAAKRAALHTHIAEGAVMQLRPVEGGIEIMVIVEESTEMGEAMLGEMDCHQIKQTEGHGHSN